MLFSSLNFLLVFFPLLIAAYFLIPKRYTPARRYVLMAFSFIFYAAGEPVYFFAILFCVFVTWLLSSFVERKNKLCYIVSLLVNLIPLVIFKYLDFIIENVNLIPFINIPKTGLIMPIGISFYTFQMLTYIIDLYRGEVKKQRNFGYLALYIFLFPQLIAGPIVRYSDVELEIMEPKESLEGFKEGLGRFIKGLAKKMLIANQACYICDTIIENDLSRIAPGMMWLAVFAYTLQIYFDFSGYSDMAIGLGKIFGFNFLENFKLPYSSLSVSDFWRRWHISMNTFFRDYIYIPLGGSRCSMGRWVFNTLVVWGVTGLWHGASWNFIAWGLYYALLLMLEKFFLGKILKAIPKFFSWAYTFFMTMIGWSFFMNDSNSIKEMFGFTLRLFGVGEVTNAVTVRALELEAYIPYLVIAMILASPIRILIKKGLEALGNSTRKLVAIPYNVVSDVVHVAALALCIAFIVGGSYNPFIYFRF